MLITEENFYRHVPVSTNPIGSDVFAMVQDDIQISKSFIVSLLGSSLYKKVSEAQEDDFCDLHPLSCEIERYICLDAFDRAIPHLDLVLTPTGFGVVSNQNVAPASADRVNRLIAKVRKAKDDSFDAILDGLRGNEDWCETPVALKYFGSLVWSGQFLPAMGYPDASRTKLSEMSGQIAVAERTLIHIISPDLHEELTGDIRKGISSPYIDTVIRLCRGYIYAYLRGDKRDVEASKRDVINYLDVQLDSFTAYAGSSAYKANHFQGYENAQEDPCFFFGG